MYLGRETFIKSISIPMGALKIQNINYQGYVGDKN